MTVIVTLVSDYSLSTQLADVIVNWEKIELSSLSSLACRLLHNRFDDDNSEDIKARDKPKELKWNTLSAKRQLVQSQTSDKNQGETRELDLAKSTHTAVSRLIEHLEHRYQSKSQVKEH